MGRVRARRTRREGVGVEVRCKGVEWDCGCLIGWDCLGEGWQGGGWVASMRRRRWLRT